MASAAKYAAPDPPPEKVVSVVQKKTALKAKIQQLKNSIEEAKQLRAKREAEFQSRLQSLSKEWTVTKDSKLRQWSDVLHYLEAERAAVSHVQHRQSDIIDIQVGNRKYTASRRLLLSEPDWLVSQLLHAHPGETSFFIDRDGDHFATILYWLRTGYAHVSSVTRAETGTSRLWVKPLATSSTDRTISTLRQLRAEVVYFGLRRLAQQLDSVLAATVSTKHKYAVLTYSMNFQPVSFIGESPEGIDLFEFDGDCFRSFKDMKKVLAEMHQAGWELETTLAPSAFNGRLVFYKKEDLALHPILAEPTLSKKTSRAALTVAAVSATSPG
jgi:hypothetical protein